MQGPGVFTMPSKLAILVPITRVVLYAQEKQVSGVADLLLGQLKADCQ